MKISNKNFKKWKLKKMKIKKKLKLKKMKIKKNENFKFGIKMKISNFE